MIINGQTIEEGCDDPLNGVKNGAVVVGDEQVMNRVLAWVALAWGTGADPMRWALRAAPRAVSAPAHFQAWDCTSGHTWEVEASIGPDSGIEYFTCTQCSEDDTVIYY